jgi:hypothetical protein
VGLKVDCLILTQKTTAGRHTPRGLCCGWGNAKVPAKCLLGRPRAVLDMFSPEERARLEKVSRISCSFAQTTISLTNRFFASFAAVGAPKTHHPSPFINKRGRWCGRTRAEPGFLCRGHQGCSTSHHEVRMTQATLHALPDRLGLWTSTKCFP